MLKPVLVAVVLAASGVLAGVASAAPPGSGCFLNGTEIPEFAANSAVFGTSGNDTIDCTASPKARLIFAGNGNGTVRGSNFNDNIKGEFGNDTLFGRSGNDFIAGGSGDDTMSGGTGTDQCVGSEGTDTGSSCETFTQ